MNFLLTQLITILLLGVVVAFYTAVVKKYFEDKIGCDPLGDFFAKNNGRGTILFIIALVLSMEMIIVYSNLGFPRSPLVIGVQEVIAENPGILEHSAAIIDRLLGERYFQDQIPKTPVIVNYGSSWWWLLSSSVAWLIVLIHLPFACLDGVRNFFRRPEYLAGTEAIRTVKVKVIPAVSESPHGLMEWIYYIFDEFIVKGFTILGQKIFGGK